MLCCELPRDVFHVLEVDGQDFSVRGSREFAAVGYSGGMFAASITKRYRTSRTY
jgi:hypothetical protein